MTETDGNERRMRSTQPSVEDGDEVLAELASELAERDAEDGERGGDDGDGERGFASDDAPFDLGIPAPRAIDLRKLWKLAGKTPDPEIAAALGPNIPVLLSHSVTAFPTQPRPPRVWAIRYAASIFGVSATVQDWQPRTDILDVVTVGSEANLEITAGGKLEVPKEATEALSAIPGVTLNAAAISADTTQSAKLRIKFVVAVPRIISGPDKDAGVRWQLYAQDRRLDGQALLQTLLAPKGTSELRVEVISSVAAKAGLFGLQRRWHFETTAFTVSLEGLG